MRARWKVLVAALGAAVVVVPTASNAVSGTGRGLQEPAKVLEVYVRSPILVRAGEKVRLPVDVVCATAAGSVCSATVTLGTRERDEGAWRLTRTAARPSLAFDLTGPAGRAAAPGGSGKVDYFTRVEGPAGEATSLPQEERASPLSFYVANQMPVVVAGAIPFGLVRSGTTVLSLSWGSGTGHAGLIPGRESATLGPPSFEVDRRGRIYLADAMQDRIALFQHGRLVRELPADIGARADMAVSDSGAIFTMDGRDGGVQVRRIDGGGAGPAVTIPGVPGQVRTRGETAFADVLPQDAWFAVDGGANGALTTDGFTSGRPVAGGDLLRVITSRSLRLGLVVDDRVTRAVEVRFGQRIGEIALAEPDGSDGYVAVVHLWRSGPAPADQFQVVRVSGGQIVETFAASDARFADTPPLGRFRLGRDGNLYQLRTFPFGLRIVRFELGGES